MGEQGEKDVIRYLNEALEADEPSEKNYYIRQALQLLDIESVDG